MKKALLLISVIVLVFVAFTYNFQDAHTSTSGAPAGRTGSPGDNANCSGCHSGAGNPIQNSPNVSLTSTIPATGYVPGQTYTVTASATVAGINKYGFQVSPQLASGTQVGTLVVTNNTETQLVGSNKYITHRTAGTAGTGTKTWQFNWTAPVAGTGAFSFYGAFVSANGSGSSGDGVHLKSLAVVEAANINTQPTAQSVCAGNTATFSVAATGTNITYQWKKNGAVLSNGGNISGAQSATLTISNTSATDVDNYTVEVTGSGNTVVSNAVALTVNSAPTISLQPQGQTLCVGGTISLSVTAAGATTYQWKRGNTNVGTNSASLNISNATANDAGQYTCVITNSCGNITTNAVTVTVNPSTAITTQPQPQAVCIGGTLTLTTAATGTGTLSYQWKRGATPVGANSATLTINNVQAGDIGSYTCEVTGTCGTVTTNAANVTVAPLPTFTTQPQSTTICAGASPTFTVNSTGLANPQYQWYVNGSAVGSPTTNTSFTATTPTNGTTVNAVIIGGCQDVSSNIVTITVNPTTTITTQPINQSACLGSSASFSVVATGVNLTYQWKKNGNNIGGQTQATLTLNNITANDAANYTCLVTGTCGAPTSNAGVLSIANTASISSQPQAQTICGGTTLTLDVVGNAGNNTTYQWLFNGNPVGTNNSTYSVPNASAAVEGNYEVTISGGCGTITSNSVVVDVTDLPEITGVSPVNPICAGTTLNIFVQANGDNLQYQWTRNGIDIQGANDFQYSESAAANGDVFTCRVWNSCDTVESAPATATINPLPVPVITQIGASTLTTEANYSSYQWLLNGNVVGSNATYDPNFVPGNYFVLVTDINGCSDTSAVFFYIPESIDEAAKLGIKIYPNPTAGDIYISGLNNEKPYTIAVYNSMGQLVVNSTMVGKYLSINTLPKGLYSLVIGTDKGIVQQRLIKE